MRIVLCPNMTLLIDRGKIPGIPDQVLLSAFRNTRVSTTSFYSDEFLLGDDERTIQLQEFEDRARAFCIQYGMDRQVVYAIIAVAVWPEKDRSMPFELRVSLFPAHHAEEHRRRMMALGAETLDA